MVRGVKICPKCNTRTGSAAKQCVCGHNFHAARLSNIRGSQSARATPARGSFGATFAPPGEHGGHGPGALDRQFSRESFGYPGAYAHAHAQPSDEAAAAAGWVPSTGAGTAGPLRMSRHSSIDRSVASDYGPGDQRGRRPWPGPDRSVYGGYSRSHSLEYDYSGRRSSATGHDLVPLAIRPATPAHRYGSMSSPAPAAAAHGPYSPFYAGTPTPAAVPHGHVLDDHRRPLYSPSAPPASFGFGRHTPSAVAGYGPSQGDVHQPSSLRPSRTSTMDATNNNNTDDNENDDTFSVSSHIARPSHSLTSGVPLSVSALPRMSAVRLYGLLPAMDEHVDTALFSVEADDGQGRRCLVSLERAKGDAAASPVYACTNKGCDEANRKPEHPLSIVALLDLHCPHIEYCTKAPFIEQSTKCDVTLDGYNRLVEKRGGSMDPDAVYRLGYEAVVEKQVPLVQRAVDGVYVVYCGVSQDAPQGFVHVTSTSSDGAAISSSAADMEEHGVPTTAAATPTTITLGCGCGRVATVRADLTDGNTTALVQDDGISAKSGLGKNSDDSTTDSPGSASPTTPLPCAHQLALMWHLESGAMPLPTGSQDGIGAGITSGSASSFLPHPSTFGQAPPIMQHVDGGGEGGQ